MLIMDAFKTYRTSYSGPKRLLTLGYILDTQTQSRVI